jgi:hypothetical protein
MPDFVISAKALLANNIAVVSVLPEDSAKILADARASLNALGTMPPGAWLADSKAYSLNRLLRVQALPTMVLVATDGLILFNGHPSEAGFWDALKKISPAIRRPALAHDVNQP